MTVYLLCEVVMEDDVQVGVNVLSVHASRVGADVRRRALLAPPKDGGSRYTGHLEIADFQVE